MDEAQHEALKKLDDVLETAARQNKKDSGFASVNIATWKNLRALITRQQETITGLYSVTLPRPAPSPIRPPGTPLDAPAPARLQDVVGHLNFFAGRPEVLQQASPEEITNFLNGQITTLQKSLEPPEGHQPIPGEWTRTRDLKEVAGQLIWTANHASSLKGSSTEKIASFLSAWGSAIIPFTDDEEESVPKFVIKGDRVSVASLVQRLRNALVKVNERPGRAWRILTEAIDQVQDWSISYYEDEPTESDTERAQTIRSRKSATQLRETAALHFSSNRSRSPSPFPEFEHLRTRHAPLSPSPTPGPTELSALTPPPRIRTPDPGNRPTIGRANQEPVPTLLTTAPTFPVQPESQKAEEAPPTQPNLQTWHLKNAQFSINLARAQGENPYTSESVHQALDATGADTPSPVWSDQG